MNRPVGSRTALQTFSKRWNYECSYRKIAWSPAEAGDRPSLRPGPGLKPGRMAVNYRGGGRGPRSLRAPGASRQAGLPDTGRCLPVIRSEPDGQSG
jgi:hypothetical protein